MPEADRHWLFEAIEPSFDFRGSRKAVVSRLSIEDAGNRVYTFGRELIAAKRAEPADDMLSVVANSTDPELSDLEVYLFFQLLFSAGAETTRNAIAGGLLALAQHPDQYRLLRGDLGLLPTAIEEILRWTSPAPSKRRTATARAVLGGQTIEAGQKVLVWEGRRTAIRRSSTGPTNSTSAVNPIRTSDSATARTSAWAPIWRDSSFGCSTRSYSDGSVTWRWWRRWNGRAAIGIPGCGT